MIGGSTETYTFAVVQLVQFKGAADFRDSTAPSTCRDLAPDTAACQLEARFTQKEVCLDCKASAGGYKWVLTKVEIPSSRCRQEATNNPRRTITPMFEGVHTNCNAYYYNNGAGACEPCHNSCFSCSGPDATDCTACAWRSGTLDTATGECVGCASDEAAIFGLCVGCFNFETSSSTTCSHCSEGLCDTCSATQNVWDKHCCERNEFLPESSQTNAGSKTCTKCDFPCKTCFRDHSDSCLSCEQGYAFNRETNTCVADCDGSNGQFYDSHTGTCQDCPYGCLECVHDGLCSKCRPYSEGFYYLDSACLYCDITEGYFLAPDRVSCESCPKNCKECSDASTCTVCDDNLGY